MCPISTPRPKPTSTDPARKFTSFRVASIVANDCYSILSAHGDNEHVLASDLEKAVTDYKKLIEFSLNGSNSTTTPAKAIKVVPEL